MEYPEPTSGSGSTRDNDSGARPGTNLLVPLWRNGLDRGQQEHAKAAVTAQVAKSIFRASPKRPSKACRQLLLFMLGHEALSLSRILTERIESYQVRDLTKGLAAMAESDAEGDNHAHLGRFRAFMRIPPGDQLLAMVELRNMLEGWAMSSQSHGDCQLDLPAFRDDLQDYFFPQQWTAPMGPTARQMFTFACGLHKDTHRGDTRAFLRVIAWLLRAADAGYSDAAASVGYYFAECGDFRKYLLWTNKAAKKGSGVGFFNLGQGYAQGVDGVKKNYRIALENFLMAERHGFSRAMSEIGHCYIKLRKYDLAISWLHRATSLGDNPYAYSALAWIYADGLGVQASKETAISYYMKAAELGLKFAEAAANRLRSPRL